MNSCVTLSMLATTRLRLKKLRRNMNVNINTNGNGHATGNCHANGTTPSSTVVMESQVKCLSYGTESNRVDEIMDISLDVWHSNSLKDALQRFFEPELLDGQNKYECERCNKLVAARKQMSILQAPNVLVIQRKRFEGLFGRKIGKSISFEEFLVLSSFMCKTSQDAMGCWYCCNDSFVSLSTLQDVLSEKKENKQGIGISRGFDSD